MEYSSPIEKPADHIESFFGVQLNEKIQEEIAGLGSIESMLRELAEVIPTLEIPLTKRHFIR